MTMSGTDDSNLKEGRDEPGPEVSSLSETKSVVGLRSIRSDQIRWHVKAQKTVIKVKRVFPFASNILHSAQQPFSGAAARTPCSLYKFVSSSSKAAHYIARN